MWSGYFKLGGNEVGNSARSLGYTRTSDCPIHWLRDRDCGGLVEALGQEQYTYDRIEQAPWYDDDEPELSGRFLGAYIVSMEGLSDSTRAATITEKNTDGAQVSGFRHTSREVRVRAMLTAKGMDALELGMTWLRNVLEPDACGTHGTSCGASDFEFFVDCPPTRGFNTTLGDWTVQRTNLFANPRGTSASSTYWGTLLGTISTVTDMPGDIETATRWTRTGAGSGEVRLNVGASLPGEGAPIHVLLQVRASEAITLNAYARPAVGSTTGQTSLGAPIVLTTGMNEVELNGSFPGVASGTAGVAFVVTDGAVSSTLDFTEVLIEGSPAGLYFDGTTEDDDDIQYAWSGAENLSQSTLALQPSIQTPQTQIEYQAEVDARKRFLHTVTCVSGPLIQESKVSSDGVHFGYLVEFTLLAAVPFVFGVTKSIEVPPLTPSVLQDVPFNLVTHPSAELSSSAPSMIAATGTAGTRMVVPTHISIAGGQTSHPSVVDFITPWNGYRYWMAHTPFPASDDTASDPNVVASTNGSTWVVPAGLSNPLDDQPGDGEMTNSDTELVYGPDDHLWLLWRTWDPDTVGGEEQMWLRRSADGVTWTAKVKVHQDDPAVRRLISPSLIWEDSGWTMYAIDTVPSPNRLVRSRMEAETMTTVGWTAPTNCTVTLPGGREPWSIEMRLVAGDYVGLLNDTVTGTAGTVGDLYVISSADGLAFTRGTAVAIPRSGGSTPGHQALERATFTMIDSRHMNVYYTGWNTGSPTVWNVFRTTLTAPQGSAAVRAATNYSPNPSAEVNRDNLDAITEVVSGGSPVAYFNSGVWVANPGGIDSLRASGLNSFYGEIQGNGSTSASGRTYVWLSQVVPFSGLAADTRMSFNVWAAAVILGGASGTTIHGINAYAVWRDGGVDLGTMSLGSAGPSEYGGRVYQLKSQLVPDDADSVLIRVRFDVSWSSSATPSLNTRIFNAIDAIAVTVP